MAAVATLGIDLFMKYEKGESIEQLLAQFHKLDQKLTRIYARDIFRALNSLHGADIVHGNLKLSNILLDSHTRRVKLTDLYYF